MIVVGIDPGKARTGLAVVDVETKKVLLVSSVDSKSSTADGVVLLRIFEAVCSTLAQFKGAAAEVLVALEIQNFRAGPRLMTPSSIQTSAMVRGVILAACAMHELEVVGIGATALAGTCGFPHGLSRPQKKRATIAWANEFYNLRLRVPPAEATSDNPADADKADAVALATTLGRRLLEVRAKLAARAARAVRQKK